MADEKLIESEAPLDAPLAGPPTRIVGLDVARAIAIGGMALIHFAIVLSTHDVDNGLGWVLDRLAGRPATAFMLLAGIGVTLQVRHSLTETRRRLWRRGLFFLACGYLNLIVWNGDILRVYGIAYLAALVFIVRADRALWTAAGGIIVLFVTLLLLVDFETNWDFATLHYHNLWTPSGAALNLFYNGFRAVLPWLSLFLLGMIVGRQQLESPKIQRMLGLIGLAMWIISETASQALLRVAQTIEELDVETSIALLGTDSMPAMPLFLLSSSGLALAGIAACLFLADRQSFSAWLRPLASAGQLAFTWYIAHIILVIAAGYLTDFRGDVSMAKAWLISGLFFAVMIAGSHAYRRRFRYGPLEWVLRSVAG